MIRPRGALAPLADAAPRWDEADGGLRSQRYADGYFGSRDVLGESRHVFLDGNDLPRRFRDPGDPYFVVGELGFGTGTNFLLTWLSFDEAADPSRRLHYIGVDAHPLRPALLARALAAQAELGGRAEALIAAWPAPVAGLHRRSFNGGRVILDLYWADVSDAVAELARNARGSVDAWYLDGFAPSRNPAMWDEAVLRDVARASRDGASLATFSAAGALRRSLGALGFEVQSRPGFGRKRESLRARLIERPPPGPPTTTPWDQPSREPAPRQRRVLVIGAGLAGCHAAAALARRGWEVSVLEAHDVAAGASGNGQGLLFNRFSQQHAALADFSLLAVEYAYHLYAGLFARGILREDRDGALTGCLQTAPPRGDFAAVQAALRDLPELATAVCAEAASARLGTAIGETCLWQPRSGWLAPAAVCRALLDQATIEVQTGCGSLELHRDADDRWSVRDSSGRERGSAATVIIAAGSACRDIAYTSALPLRVARGQTTQIPTPPGQTLSTSLCHRGYIAPAVDGYHSIGATFSPGDADRSLRPVDNRHNLDELARALPAWSGHLASLDPETLSGRAGLRCVSPDYLPLVGPIPDLEAFRRDYAPLARDARSVLPGRGRFVPGLYVTTAHGSRGLSYAALAAELLAAQICGEPPPLSTDLVRAIAPARFAIRAIVRGDSVVER